LAADTLLDIIATARAALPEIPAESWQRFEDAIRRDFGAQRIYVAAKRKRLHIDAIQRSVELGSTSGQIAVDLHLSRRRVEQLRQLLAPNTDAKFLA